MPSNSFKYRKNRWIRKCRKQLLCWLFDHKKTSPFTPSSVKKILFLRDENKIGDMIISTATFHAFANHGIIVDVLAGPDNACIIQHNPDVRHIHIIHSKKQKYQLARQLRSEQYDLIINTDKFVNVDAMLTVRLAKPKHAISYYKSFKLFDLPQPIFDHNSHITHQHRAMANYLGIQNYQAQYLIFIPDTIKQDIQTFLLEQHITPFIVINPFGISSSRHLSQQQIQEIICFLTTHYPKHAILCVGKPGGLDGIQSDHIIKCQFPTFFHTVELIRHCDLVISPDTSIVHVAASFHKPLVCLYEFFASNNPFQHITWGPNYQPSIQILAPLVDNVQLDRIDRIPITQITHAISAMLPIKTFD